MNGGDFYRLLCPWMASLEKCCSVQSLGRGGGNEPCNYVGKKIPCASRCKGTGESMLMWEGPPGGQDSAGCEEA
jgi:hypothetical protein